MKTYIFTFDVNNSDEIKSAILQMPYNSSQKSVKEENDEEIIKQIVVRCIQRFLKVNEFNPDILKDLFWNIISGYLRIFKKLEINILSLDEIFDKTDLNKKLTETGNKYDMFINCCNMNIRDDYFIYEKHTPILLYDN